MSKNSINAVKYPYGIQKAVVEKTGLSRRTVSTYFNRKSSTSVKTQKLIRKALADISIELEEE